MRVDSDIVPKAGKFEVVSDFEPSGDQPAAIDDLEPLRRFERAWQQWAAENKEELGG